MKSSSSLLRRIIPLLISLVLLSCSSKKNEKSKVPEVRIKMTDGVELATDLYIPKGKRKYPTILIRTPYNKQAEAATAKGFRLFNIAVVVQDVRGKNGSGGEFYPFANERSDGLETLRWIRKQPWSDGTVCGWGGSYVGVTQWAVADSLNLMFPLLTGGNLYDFVYPDSLFSLHSALSWGVINASNSENKIPKDKLLSMMSVLPLSAADDSAIKDVRFLDDWITHEKADEYWQALNFRNLGRAQMVSIAGWYDIFLKAQLDDFIAAEKRDSGNSNKIIIGPWCHGSQGEENDYGGTKKTGNPAKLFLYAKNLLKGRKAQLPKPLRDSKYNLFVMERNEYVGSDIWPPSGTKITPYYIGPEGYLSKLPLNSSGSLKYNYDPADPYPSLGGTILGDGVGPSRQNSNVTRTDQLVFEMKINDKPLTLLGPISATLWVSSDAACTDFITGIQDVFPDGKIINIQEGGVRLEKTEKGVPRQTEISVWSTGYQLNPGHRLRVFIASSWHPRYNRNLNNCQPLATGYEPVTAAQSVYYGDKMSSSINLPIFEDQNSNKGNY